MEDGDGRHAGPRAGRSDGPPHVARGGRLRRGRRGVDGAAARRAGIGRRPPRLQLMKQPDSSGAPAADQLHLTFGADTARSMIVSWSTPVPVRPPAVRYGSAAGGHSHTGQAQLRHYTEGISGETVWTYHAHLDHLDPDTDSVYGVLADGAPPVRGTFRTAPTGRRPFRFTSFGDQAIPAPVGSGALVGPNTPNAGYVVGALGALDRQPLFHLM